MHLSVQQMTSLPVSVSVLVLGIGIARHQSIGYWVLAAKLGIVLTLVFASSRLFTFRNGGTQCLPIF